VTQKEKRIGGTKFGFVRFNVPKLCDFKGRAIYLDADQLVFGNIEDLHNSLDDEHSVAVVDQPEGDFGGKKVAKHYQTSVMVLNCEKLQDWNPPGLFENVIPDRSEASEGKLHYRDFMRLSWIDPKR